MVSSEYETLKIKYDALAKENERLAKIQQDDESEKYKYMDERNRLKAELLNTKELSSKLVEENAALKAEVERLRVQLAGCGVAALQNTEESRAVRVEPHAYGWSQSYQDVCNAVDREIELRDQLTSEREISAMLREALERANYQNDYYDQKPHKAIELVYSNREALAREKEMRK